MRYELWEIESGNRMQAYATEREALEFVRVTVAEFGSECMTTWELVRVPALGDAEPVAVGRDLVTRALQLRRAS